MKPKKLVIRKPISQTTKIALGILSVFVMLCFYEFLSWRQYNINPSNTTMPGFAKMASAFQTIVTPDHLGHIRLWNDVKASCIRHATGLGLGVILSVVIGLGMSCFGQIESIFLPPLTFFAKIPPTAMLAVFFILFGTDFNLYVSMIAFGVLPTLTQTVYQSAKYDVPDELVNKAYTLGASNFEVVWNVILPHIMPRLIEAVRLSVGPAMVYLIAAEWISGDVGFGYRLKIESRLSNMAVVYDYILILGAIGFLMDWSLTKLRDKMCPWFKTGK